KHSGTLPIAVRVDWLTCDDEACVPGRVELELNLPVGLPAPGEDAAVLAEALERTPTLRPGWELSVKQKKNVIGLSVLAADQRGLSDAVVHSMTEQVFDPSDPPTFALKRDTLWKSHTKPSEFIEDDLEKLEL